MRDWTNYRDRKNLQVKNQKEYSLIVDVGCVLGECSQRSRKHLTEEQQAKVAYLMEYSEGTELPEAGRIKCKESKKKAEDKNLGRKQENQSIMSSNDSN